MNEKPRYIRMFHLYNSISNRHSPFSVRLLPALENEPKDNKHRREQAVEDDRESDLCRLIRLRI